MRSVPSGGQPATQRVQCSYFRGLIFYVLVNFHPHVFVSHDPRHGMSSQGYALTRSLLTYYYFRLMILFIVSHLLTNGSWTCPTPNGEAWMCPGLGGALCTEPVWPTWAGRDWSLLREYRVPTIGPQGSLAGPLIVALSPHLEQEDGRTAASSHECGILVSSAPSG